jgi:hypothetical protein
MRTRTFVLSFALCVISAVCFAADPNMGTWKLNEGRSKIAPGTPKNSTVVYEAAGDNVKITIDGTGGDGKPLHNEWTGKFDGKDYPVTGDSAEDARSVKKVNDRALTATLKKAGKVTGTAHIVVAPDGKSRTVTVTRTDAGGKKVTSTAVYDKQ